MQSKQKLEDVVKHFAELPPGIEQETENLSKYVLDSELRFRTSSTQQNIENQKYYFACVYLPKTCGK